MTARRAGWSLILVEEMSEADWVETELRGVLLNSQLESDGRRFPVIFFDPDRIHSSAVLETEDGEPSYEKNVILLPAVTKAAVEAAVDKLGKAGEFDWLLV